MKLALTASQIQGAEQAAIARGVTSRALMERAGREVARHLAGSAPAGRVAIVCGPGQNGGDGWVAARALAEDGRPVHVLATTPPDGLSGDAADAAEAALADGVHWTVPEGVDGFAAGLAEAAAVVDSLLGTGSRGAPRGAVADAVEAIAASGRHVVSVDLPTGVDPDTGAVEGGSVVADSTVTFTAVKPGLLMYPGASRAGDVRVADVGVPADCLPASGAVEVWEREDYARLLPVPAPDAHKNERGRLLIVAGSRAYAGAAALAALGSVRSGAGYVTLAVPESIAQTMQAKLSTVVVTGLAENLGGTLSSKAFGAVMTLAADHDAVVVGPGMTLAHSAVLLVRGLVRELDRPLLVDADGINSFVDAVDLLFAREGPLVLTPHPGELARLLGVAAPLVQADRVTFARRLSGEGRVCVLKGARTVLAGSGRTVLCTAGNPGMATAGSGDVLAGIAGTFLAQGLAPLDAAALAVHLHASAGDHAAQALTQTCMSAEDIPSFMPAAVRSLRP